MRLIEGHRTSWRQFAAGLTATVRWNGACASCMWKDVGNASLVIALWVGFFLSCGRAGALGDPMKSAVRGGGALGGGVGGGRGTAPREGADEKR